MDKVPWNRAIVNEFVSLAMLTAEEEHIVHARALGWNRAKMCHEFSMSLATLDRIIHKLKIKYQYASNYSDILPKDIDF